MKFPDMIVLKEIASPRHLVEDEGQILATVSGNTIPVDGSYDYLSATSIQNKTRRRQANYNTTNVKRIS